MRTLTAGAISAIDGGTVALALLVEMDLTGGALYLNQSALDLVINGVTYYGTHGLGQVESCSNTGSEMPRLSFTLSGVPSDKVSLALSENPQGRPVRVKVALFNSSTGALLDVSLRYSGILDVFTIEDGPEKATLSVNSEAGVRDLLRACNVLYSHNDQAELGEVDLFFQYINAQVEQKIVFPARHWFIANPEK